MIWRRIVRLLWIARRRRHIALRRRRITLRVALRWVALGRVTLRRIAWRWRKPGRRRSIVDRWRRVKNWRRREVEGSIVRPAPSRPTETKRKARTKATRAAEPTVEAVEAEASTTEPTSAAMEATTSAATAVASHCRRSRSKRNGDTQCHSGPHHCFLYSCGLLPLSTGIWRDFPSCVIPDVSATGQTRVMRRAIAPR